MRNFYLIVNREKPRVEEAAGLICSFFAEQGCRCIRLDRHDGLRRDAEVAAAYRYTDRRTVPEDTDCVICLGGDGTLIQAARDLAGRKIPLFGINMGHLGYLTQIGHEEDGRSLPSGKPDDAQGVRDFRREGRHGGYRVE